MKQVKNTVTVVLVCILTLQVTQLEPRLPVQIGIYEIGFFTTIQEKARPFFSYRERVIETLLTAATPQEYDSLIFVGDIMMARNVEQLMKREDSSYPFDGLVLKKLTPNPAIIGNFEASMAEQHVQTEINQLKFSVDKRHLPALKQAGFTHLSLANNHSFDYFSGSQKGRWHPQAIFQIEWNKQGR